MTSLQSRLNEISPLTAESQTEFLNAWRHWSVSKDHLLVRESSVSNYIYFVEKGIARIFYHKNGKEVTEWIAMDEQFFLSLSSFYMRTPSRLIIQTLEPSEIYGIHHNDLMSLVDKYRDVERLLRNMMTGGFIMSQQRMFSMQFESAQQRYKMLLETQPSIIQRVPLSHIASFLGITPETLSRIRAMK
ncbi:MAG: Crp/Fnr family transcriptional regulator [Mucilaginibacter sp.]